MTQANDLISNGFDLDALQTDAATAVTFRVPVIFDEDGNEKSGFIIVGKNSAEYQAAARVVRIAGLQAASKRKGPVDTSTEEGAAAMAKRFDESEMTLACSVVKDWFGFATNGVAAPFDKAMANKLLARFPTWLDKITAAVEVDANFMKG